MDGLSKPEICSDLIVSFNTEEEIYLTLVTRCDGTKFVPPKEVVWSIYSAVHSGWKSLRSDWMASSPAPHADVNYSVVLFPFSLAMNDSSTTMCAGGNAGGSLYTSLFWLTRHVLYAEAYVGSPIFWDAASVAFLCDTDWFFFTSSLFQIYDPFVSCWYSRDPFVFSSKVSAIDTAVSL